MDNEVFCTDNNPFKRIKIPYICHLKFFTIIFSIYLLTLFCLPCSDNDNCKNIAIEQSVCSDKCCDSQPENQSNQDNNCDNENCSPFCLCACCGQLCNFTNHQTNLGFDVLKSSATQANYQTAFVSEICFTIWQPPKIC